MHLSSDQICEWSLGERDVEIERHLDNCDACRDEVIRLQEGLRTFRQAAHAWAERDQRSAAATLRPHRIATPVAWTWAAATVLTCGLVLAPAYLETRSAQREVQSTEDSLLLNQVQERLTRSVPQSMEQLMELMNEGKEDQQ